MLSLPTSFVAKVIFQNVQPDFSIMTTLQDLQSFSCSNQFSRNIRFVFTLSKITVLKNVLFDLCMIRTMQIFQESSVNTQGT